MVSGEGSGIGLYRFLIIVPFPYGVWGRKWNWIVSVSDHCSFSVWCLGKEVELDCIGF